MNMDNKESSTNTKSNTMNMSAVSPFHGILQPDPTISLSSIQNEGMDFTLEQILNLGDDSLGLKVLLTAKQSSWLGVINIILKNCRKISLEKVSDPKTGKKKLGLRTFFFHDVLNIKVLGEDQEARQRLLKDMYFEKQQGKKLLRKKLLPIDLQEKCSSINPEEEVVPGLIKQLLTEEARVKSSPTPLPQTSVKLPRPSKWIIIDVVDDSYNKAAAEIYLHMLNQQGSVPLLVPTLSSLLLKHLSLNIHHHLPDGQEYSKVDDCLWLERPLAESLGERLAIDVMYLRELRVEQLDMMLVDLRQIFEIYLGAMRDKDSLTVSQLEPQVVPAEVQKLGKHPVPSVTVAGMPFIQHGKGVPRRK